MSTETTLEEAEIGKRRCSECLRRTICHLDNKLELKDDMNTLTSHDGSREGGDQQLQEGINI